MFLLEKSRYLKPLSQKSDLDLLRKSASSFSFQWLKVFFYKEDQKDLKVAFSLPKKYISLAVTRNRLKRWGRESLKKSGLKGLFLVVLLKKDKGFYKKLKRKEFIYVFHRVLEKILRES